MAVRRLNPKSLSFLSLLLLFSIASAKVFFEERFEGQIVDRCLKL
ncbi:hypothetical protein Hanom_Chr04g00345221 [Helianthus anomalus]